MTGLVVVGHCRAGFEPEAALDVERLGGGTNAVVDIDAPIGRGFVVGRIGGSDVRVIARSIARAELIFVRSLFIGTGPHSLLDGATASPRPDRIAPLLALVEHLRSDFPWSAFQRPAKSSAFTSLRLETADTNDGKTVSGLARSLAARLTNGLVAAGAMRESDDGSPSLANLHVLLVDGAHAYVGVSLPPWASRWPMGIPRLRMPGGAPSRSTLKLAEAFVTFLGEREAEVLRPGMRAVDLGAAPGGWTWQLAHRGLRVVAVDNGPMKGDVRDDPLVTHVRADGLSFRPRRPVDWMVCDIVEQPSRIATLVASWIRDGHAPRSMFNLKLPMKKRYDEVRRCASLVGDALDKARVAHTLTLRHLYHDRDEVTGFVTRYDSPGMIPRRT